MLFVEIGNSTLKIARRISAGLFVLERLTNADDLIERLRRETDPITIAPVAEGRALEILPLLSAQKNVRLLERSLFTDFIGDSYDTPDTLGLDRILNLFAVKEDGIVISCGTAITIDAIVDGRPYWGAIIPGFRTAAQGLHNAAPALPIVSADDLGSFPARTSRESVANGVILGTALAVSGLADLLAKRLRLPAHAPVILTGGDAPLMSRLLHIERPVEVRPALLFEGMAYSSEQ